MTTRPARARRSQLSVPGSSEKMLQKGAESAADHVFCDLEDAVAPAVKVEARAKVAWASTPSTGAARPVVYGSTT